MCTPGKGTFGVRREFAPTLTRREIRRSEALDRAFYTQPKPADGLYTPLTADVVETESILGEDTLPNAPMVSSDTIAYFSNQPYRAVPQPKPSPLARLTHWVRDWYHAA
jgi:hypothetical protein